MHVVSGGQDNGETPYTLPSIWGSQASRFQHFLNIRNAIYRHLQVELQSFYTGQAEKVVDDPVMGMSAPVLRILPSA